jgi:hypothetical protein
MRKVDEVVLVFRFRDRERQRARTAICPLCLCSRATVDVELASRGSRTSNYPMRLSLRAAP